ncbi:MAG: PIG-L deacetylase family protein [Actinomycetes bacterium]
MTLLLDTSLPTAGRLDGRTVVVLHAHPDDEAVFTGATVRRLADRGARVVLVTATAGEMGTPRFAVDDIAAVRRAELERAAEELGVARLVLLGRRDSGLPGWESTAHPDALLRADLRALGTTLARLVEREQAEAVVTYDADGIYGHPDHVAVHLVGRYAAGLTGRTVYESTVDREHLHFAGAHVLDAATASVRGTRYGRVTAEITTALAATPSELAAKRRAMAAHTSQIDPAELDDPGFADAYELEWFVRRGPAGLLDELGNVHALA